MTKQTEALKMAMYELEIVGLKDGDTYNACKEALAEDALNKMARNAEELGLDYDLQKEWQSLSDGEIDEIWVKSFGSSEIVHNLDFARAIEAKLKEKNHESIYK